MYKLYGDGIHDDYPAIQELIDSGVCEVSLPAPEKFYLISQTLLIPSNFRLILPRYAEIRLTDGANCFMVRNRWVEEYACRVADFHSDDRKLFWNYVNETSPAPEHACENFEIVGGIWNFNNMNQKANPQQSKEYDESCYPGYGMLFYNVKNFRLSSMTLKDPVNFAVTIDTAAYFTVEDITFDFNYGNPYAINMDGIHLDGNCHYGCIRNLKGACYDDLVALNACEGSAGPITDIEIDGIFAEKCHSAVRLLAIHEELARIHICNVFGTFYQYCIAFSKYYSPKVTKGFDAISIDHIYAAKATRYSYLYPWPESYVYPLIWFEEGVIARNVTLETIHRREYNVSVETIYIGDNTSVEALFIRDVSVENHTGRAMPLLVNHGHIKNMSFTQIRSDGEEIFVNKGTIEELQI